MRIKGLLWRNLNRGLLFELFSRCCPRLWGSHGSDCVHEFGQDKGEPSPATVRRLGKGGRGRRLLEGASHFHGRPPRQPVSLFLLSPGFRRTGFVCVVHVQTMPFRTTKVDVTLINAHHNGFSHAAFCYVEPYPRILSNCKNVFCFSTACFASLWICHLYSWYYPTEMEYPAVMYVQ